MTAKYDFYLTPQPKDKQPKVRYHARMVVNETLTNKDIATEISKRCTINRAEALAVMDEIQQYCPAAMITVSDVKAVRGGYMRSGGKRRGPFRKHFIICSGKLSYFCAGSAGIA